MTKLFGVIGHPIAHSLSPIMHQAVYQDLKIDANYSAFNVKSSYLSDAIKGMKALGIDGLNVTIPHKVAIMEYLDKIDVDALAIGAVNTVKNENGKLVGYNTDGPGFVSGLKTLVDLKGKNVLVIGAGGAARGIAITLAKSAIKSLTITNRTIDKAKEIIGSCFEQIGLNVMEAHHAAEALAQFDIIINTTSVGLYPNTEAVPLDLSNLRDGSVVSDIIYNPFYTKWLKEAKAKGALVQNGLPMFVNQGALAFEIWLGVKPNLKVMENAVIQQLGGNETC